MSKKRVPDNRDDADVFRSAVRDTQPLADGNRLHARTPAPKPRLQPRPTAEQQRHDTLLNQERQALGTEPMGELSYRRPGVQDRVFRKLRSGKFLREDELDLHGMTVDQARVALAEFLTHCHLQGLRCVRIIHGKGLRSGDRGPVLKNSVGIWLRDNAEVLALCPAQGNEGGSGASYVLLRKSKD